jgi:hypothetical protein
MKRVDKAPFRWIVWMLALVAAHVSIVRERPGAALQGQVVSLRADDNTPLATVLTQLEERYGWVITYEDPVYEHSSEVLDVTHLARRPLDPSEPPFWCLVEDSFFMISSSR